MSGTLACVPFLQGSFRSAQVFSGEASDSVKSKGLRQTKDSHRQRCGDKGDDAVHSNAVTEEDKYIREYGTCADMELLPA